MPRRADLILRTKALHEFLPLKSLKWLSVEDASKYEQKDYYVSGTIVKIYPLISAESSAWNFKEHHLGLRKGMLIRDNAPDADKNKCQFSAMFYGTYAQDIDGLNPKLGEIVTIVNPTSFSQLRKRTLDKENYLQDVQVVVGQKFRLTSKVCFHSELPSVYLRRLSLEWGQKSSDLLVKEVTIAPKIASAKKQVKSTSSAVQYTPLKDCVESSRKYNAFGVVTRISRAPELTRTGRYYMAQVYIKDPESDGTFGFKDYQFSLLATEKASIPPIALNSIMRYMKIF